MHMLIAALAAAAASGASASDTAATAKDSAAAPGERAAAAREEAESIVVTGRRLPSGSAEVKGRPGGSDLVMADEYSDKLAVSLKDSLAFSPGVYAQPRFGQEIRLSIRGSGISRGFHMRGLTLLQDGIPINLADDNGDFQELDPTILTHLEVYRGANAFRFGGTTLGGAINGVTPTGRTRKGLNLRSDGGSWQTLRGLGMFGWASNGVDAFAAITGDRSDGERQHAKRRALRGMGNIGFNVSSNVQTRFYVNANYLRQELPGSLSYVDAIKKPRKGNTFGDQQRNIDSLRVANRTNIHLDAVDLEFGGFANFKHLDHPIFQVVDERSTDTGIFARAGMKFGMLELLTGATARFGTVDAKRFVNINGQKGAKTLQADRYAQTIDVYTEGRYQIGQAYLIAGGIFTHGIRKQHQIVPVDLSPRTKFEQFSPRLGVLWQPGSDLQFYANFSRSHELPGFIELAQIAAFVPLKAQHAWTAEIGGRGKFGPAKFDVSFYRANVRNELLQFSIGPDIPASTFNADKTVHQGIEAGLDIELADWAKVRQIYQFNDFRFSGDAQYGNNRLPVIAKHLYRGEVRLGPDAWHVSPTIEWVPKGAWADYRNTFRVAGYTMFSVSGAVKLIGDSEFFVDLRNLNNKKAVGDMSAVINYSGQVMFSPIERRAVYVGVRARM